MKSHSDFVVLEGRKIEVEHYSRDPERRLLPDMPQRFPRSTAILCSWPRDRFLHYYSDRAGFDVAVLDESGTVVETHTLPPESVRGITSSVMSRRALALPLGWIERNCLVPGALAEFSRPLTTCLAESMPRILIGPHAVAVEVTHTECQLIRGLMFRKRLTSEEGMLFPFARSLGSDPFWMKNTFIPLDIAYFDRSGCLLNVASVNPARDPERFGWTIRAPCAGPYKAVLEVRKGWFLDHGLVSTEGRPSGFARIDLSAALK